LAVPAEALPIGGHKRGVADPATCGEDLARNLRRIFAIARQHCGDCADYHVVKTAMRFIGTTAWEGGARPHLLASLRSMLDRRRESGGVDIVIAACADTAVLSACAHAACLAGDAVLNDTRFTVLDRCRSPLELCEDFGAMHGLQVETAAVDLSTTARRFPADIVVVHNLLAFMPEETHKPLLRNLAGSLKDDGRILLWIPLFPGDDHKKARLREQKRSADIRAQIESGRIAIEEPLDVFVARLDRGADGSRPGERCYPDRESVTRLIAMAGLQVYSLDEIAPFGGTLAKLKIVAGLPGK
jgi:hypothetical protein